jgi:ParB family chromosome partitioning protein
MTGESRGLGRGLGALLGAKPPAIHSSGVTLPLTAIQAGPSQPRRDIARAALEDLAASIKAKGVIQPIVVRPLPASATGAAQYEIIAGERRWRAAQLAGLTDIPATVRESTDQEAVVIALIENIQREELTAAEEARALQRLLNEFSLTHQQVADAVGRSRAAVSNLLRLLDLPDAVVALIDSKTLSMGHARALLGLDDDADRARLGRLVADRGLSVRETEELVRKAMKGEATPSHGKSPDLSVVTEILRTSKVHVQLHQRASGAGRIIVEFADSESRDALLNAIKAAD